MALIRLEPGRHPDGFWISSAYFERGYPDTSPSISVLPEIASRLAQASAVLQEHDTGLMVLDGWRPRSLQELLWSEYRKLLARDSNLTGEALDERLQAFVTPLDQDEVPPHLTGGAVDVTLCSPSGDALAMGGEFDELTDRSHPGYYERDALSAAEKVFRDRRQLLCDTMSSAGFIRLPTEWWHFEYGTPRWEMSIDPGVK